jgi:hypothetical protein
MADAFGDRRIWTAVHHAQNFFDNHWAFCDSGERQAG